MDGKGRFIDNIFVERLWRSLKYEEVVCYERDLVAECDGSDTRRSCATNATVAECDGSDALPKMRVGPSESACRSGLQTATSCGG